MLIFIDESYSPEIPIQDRYYTLGAIALPLAQHRDLNREIYNLTKRFWPETDLDKF